MEEEQPKEKEREFFDMFMMRAVMGEHLFNNNRAAENMNNNTLNNQTVYMEELYYEFIDLMRDLVYEDNESRYDDIIDEAQSRIDLIYSEGNDNEIMNEANAGTPPAEQPTNSSANTEKVEPISSNGNVNNTASSSKPVRVEKRPLEKKLNNASINPNLNRHTRRRINRKYIPIT